MSSSTSSSRRVYLKIFLAIMLGMAASMGIIRLFSYVTGLNGDALVGRVLKARAALPRIVAEEEDLMMLFGSSTTHAGFAARQFDRQLAERGIHVKSFNFGFGGLNPYFQEYISRQVREAFQDNGKRLSLALVEFIPFQLTTRRFDLTRPFFDSYMASLASPEEIWEITLQDPKRGLRIYNIRYVRDNVSAELLTYLLGGSLRPPRPMSNLTEDEENTRRLRDLDEQITARVGEDGPDYGGDDWHYGRQGAGTIPEERSESTLELFAQYYEAVRTPRRMENDKLFRIFCCDIEELHFEEELVAAFIHIVNNFQQFSDHVEVILFPRNTEWIQYPPEAVERMAVVLGRIRNETGVTIRDYQLLEQITPEMFSDTTHLSRYRGDVAFTAHLVEEYAAVLAQTTQKSP